MGSGGVFGTSKVSGSDEPGLMFWDFFFCDDMCKVGFSRLWKTCFTGDEVQPQLFPTLEVQWKS